MTIELTRRADPPMRPSTQMNTIDRVKVGECSRSVVAPLSRSRLGPIALLCWAIVLSSTAQPTRRLQRRSLHRSSSRPRLASSAAEHRRPAPSLRHAHTSAGRPRSTTANSSAPISSPQALVDHSFSQRATLSSLSHSHTPQPRTDNWLDRLSSSLASILRAVEQDTAQHSGHDQSPNLSRRRARATGLISQYIQDPNIYDPIVAPRHPIVLCHGLYGFDVRGPFLGLEIHYWAETLDILREKIGAEVLIHGVPGTGSIQERAESLHKFLCSDEAGVRGKKLNFIGHSMGGLDVRYLLTHIRPTPEQYIPLSLTTVNTPHRGSPFMDWCNANVGTGNDYIEKAIAEARAERKEDRQGPPAVKVPYTLKTPLFIRPKPSNSSSGASQRDTSPPQDPKAEQEADRKADQDAASKVSGVASDAISALAGHAKATVSNNVPSKRSESELTDKVKEVFKRGQSDNGKLPFGLSGFIGSLTSLTGAFSSYMLSLVDTPAYAMLSTAYMTEAFNPKTPNVDGVKYYSVAARTPSVGIWHPLWLPKLILDAAAESRTSGGETDGSADALGGADQGNDGLVNVESAKWGEFLGIMEGCDHWDLRGGGAPRWKQNINPATGKPYPNKGAPKQQDRKSSWTDINRLLFSRSQANTSDPAEFLKTYNELGRGEGWAGVSIQDIEKTEDWLNEVQKPNENDVDDAAEASVASFLPSELRDDTLVHDLANWISERLPVGDASREAMDEEREKLIHATGLHLDHDVSSAADNESRKSSSQRHLLYDASSKSGFIGSSASQPHTAAFSTGQTTPASASSGNGVRSTKDHSDLEQFWIAISRHLHRQGV